MQKFTSAIIFSILATFTAAAPAPQATTALTVPAGYVVRLKCNLAEEVDASPVIVSSDPIGAEINVLADASQVTCTEIDFTGETAFGVALDTIECRSYKDAAGTIPQSAPFTLATPALLATPGNGVEVGSILCYVV